MNSKDLIQTLELHLEANRNSIDGLRKSRDDWRDAASAYCTEIVTLKKKVETLESNSANSRDYLSEQSGIINALSKDLKQKNEQYNELLAVKNNLSYELSKVKQTKPFDIEKQKASTQYYRDYYRDICKSYQETLEEKNDLINRMDVKIGVLKIDQSALENRLKDQAETIERLQGLILNMKQSAQEIVKA